MIKNDPGLGNCIWTSRKYKETINISWGCNTLGFPECHDSCKGSRTVWELCSVATELLKEILAPMGYRLSVKEGPVSSPYT